MSSTAASVCNGPRRWVFRIKIILIDAIASRKAGANDNGKPGERDYAMGYYAAYVLDPDGNNVECLYYQPLWLSVIQWAPMVLGAAVIGGLSWFVSAKGLTV